MNSNFDILIVGGGHSGCEAAWIASQFGLRIGLLSMKGVGLASAPCNPAVGGVGKGQVVRELDCLGGLIGKLADMSGIQYRLLNDSKGYALQSTRVQIDKEIYSQNAEKLLSKISNLSIIREKLIKFSKKSELFEVETENNIFTTKKLIITTGTFLAGKLHCGTDIQNGGRSFCQPSGSLNSLNDKVKKLSSKFKTGTPPRLDRNTIDFTKLIEQKSDSDVSNFHCLNFNKDRQLDQVSCFLTHTNERMMSIIRENINSSPVFNGQINGVGPRYCPSIEDKASRYPDRNIHHVFVEPEGLNINTFYPNGLSTSLPIEIQQKFINTMNGLEEAKILQPGYAVEYDVIDTTALNSSLEVIDFPGLYFAGQVNGTSGYEEAAAQGYVTGVNAALSLLEKSQLVFSRFDSYIGVLVEDLITKERDEPYRLFAARSENRLYIREDNTILRMWSYRTSLNLNLPVDKFNTEFFEYNSILENLDEKSNVFGNDYLKLKNPIEYINTVIKDKNIYIPNYIQKAFAINKKYEGYIVRLKKDISKIEKFSNKKINWKKLCSSNNISFECKQRIQSVKPESFGQLKNINGIRQATLLYVSGNI